jgi:hypothetical protein
VKLRDFKKARVKLKRGYPAAYIAKVKKRKALKRHCRKGVDDE